MAMPALAQSWRWLNLGKRNQEVGRRRTFRSQACGQRMMKWIEGNDEARAWDQSSKEMWSDQQMQQVDLKLSVTELESGAELEANSWSHNNEAAGAERTEE